MLRYCVIISALLGSAMAAQKDVATKYEVEQAKVIYEISGGGVLTDELNLTIEGNERFFVRHWGHERLWRTEITEKITGLLEDMHNIRHIIKVKGDEAFEVDFERQKIIKVPAEKSPYMQFDPTNMQYKGNETIASKVCEVWESEQMKVCLYKGVPLLYEKRYMDFRIVKRAHLILTDVNLSDKDFDLPAYPIEERMLLKSGFKITNMHALKSMTKQLCNAQIKPDRQSLKQKNIKKRFLDALLKRQKGKLPKMLKAMQKARICFSVANDQQAANRCFVSLSRPLKAFVQTENSDISLWTQALKEKIVTNLDSTILELQRRIPCIQRAKDIDYLVGCMK